MTDFSDVLLTADYDRTLTARDSTVPRRNLEAIRYFMEHGGTFTVNSGRSLPMCAAFVDIVPVNAPLLLYNGSAACRNGELSQCHPIELDMWTVLRETSEQFPDLNVEVQGIDAHYCLREYPDYHKFYQALHCASAQAEPGQDLGMFLKFSVFGTILEYNVDSMFRGPESEMRRLDEAEVWLKQKYGDKIELLRAAPRILDIQARGVSKLKAARQLQQRLGKKILVCVGDADNDLSMLEGADYAFCPSDGVVADRFPNVCPCGDGAVADVIYKKIPEILEGMA